MNCTLGSICFEMAKGVPAAVVTFVIGCIAARITYNQFAVAKAKLKLDLFEKRYSIFHQTWVILSETVSKGTKGKNYGLSTPFNNYMPEARFLFGPEIETYLREAVKKWIELSGYEAEDDLSSRAKNAAKASEVRKWFFDEATNVRDVFAEYLDFKNWK
jgi:hypothetical protein